MPHSRSGDCVGSNLYFRNRQTPNQNSVYIRPSRHRGWGGGGGGAMCKVRVTVWLSSRTRYGMWWVHWGHGRWRPHQLRVKVVNSRAINNDQLRPSPAIEIDIPVITEHIKELRLRRDLGRRTLTRLEVTLTLGLNIQGLPQHSAEGWMSVGSQTRYRYLSLG